MCPRLPTYGVHRCDKPKPCPLGANPLLGTEASRQRVTGIARKCFSLVKLGLQSYARRPWTTDLLEVESRQKKQGSAAQLATASVAPDVCSKTAYLQKCPATTFAQRYKASNGLPTATWGIRRLGKRLIPIEGRNKTSQGVLSRSWGLPLRGGPTEHCIEGGGVSDGTTSQSSREKFPIIALGARYQTFCCRNCTAVSQHSSRP